jgi:hypothetical protein
MIQLLVFAGVVRDVDGMEIGQDPLIPSDKCLLTTFSEALGGRLLSPSCSPPQQLPRLGYAGPHRGLGILAQEGTFHLSSSGLPLTLFSGHQWSPASPSGHSRGLGGGTLVKAVARVPLRSPSSTRRVRM